MPSSDSDRNPAVIGSIPDSPTPSDPDLPADSILIRIDDGFDWSDLNAAVFTREYSTKGSTNPKSMIQSHPNPNPNSLSTSQRFSANPKLRAPIIGFSSVSYEGLRRQKDVPGPLPPPAYLEPASPKVSCLGRVSSERSRGDGKVRCWSGFVTDAEMTNAGKGKQGTSGTMQTRQNQPMHSRQSMRTNRKQTRFTKYADFMVT